MNRSLSLLASPFARIAWTSAVVVVLLVVMMVRGAPPMAIALVGYLGPLAVVLWIMDESRQKHRTPCFDFGFFVYATYPFSLIWYCVSTRGWRGWLLVMAVLGMVYVPYLLAALVATVLMAVTR